MFRHRLGESQIAVERIATHEVAEAGEQAIEGEISLLESTEERRRLRTRLGLRPLEDGRKDLNAGSVAPPAETGARRRQQRKPGRRRPVRDAVGVTNFAHANAASL
ncbi:MAG: hypothetical protein L0177_03330, partial [Chloroflexi bacterium]|nr:hypothetical protein [Chloroflexota bacterium]